MGPFVGIDGIKGGWVAVYLEGKNALGFKKADRLEKLLTEPYTRAMVDIPIGLPKGGYRRCDLEAKKLPGTLCQQPFSIQV